MTLKRQWLLAYLWAVWADSRMVLWAWDRMHERTRVEWKAGELAGE